MQGIEFDQSLSEGLELITEARWDEAREVLQARLDQAGAGGHKRLNLFLLSIACASGGHGDEANSLWAQAQQAPLGDLTPRYLDIQLAPNDLRQSVLLDLERAWWNFNGWNAPRQESIAEYEELSVDWEQVVDCMQRGDSATLENLYGQSFSTPNDDSPYLWNLLALTYLEAGNVRTYDEMAGSSPPLASAGGIPDALKEALESRGLKRALEAFTRGEWLSYTSLSTENLGPTEQAQEFEQSQWEHAMEEGFALIDLNQLHEANRQFQTAASSSPDMVLRMLSLNALCLGFFKLGDYTQAETLHKEFENLRQAGAHHPNSPELERFRRWLQGVGVTPQTEETFFDPFTLMAESHQDSGEQEQIDFWQSLSQLLAQIADGQHAAAKRALQSLEQLTSAAGDETRRYLVVLAYLCSAVLAGDHFEVQEFEQELNSLQNSVTFKPEELAEAKDTFAWSGFDTLSLLFDRFAGGKPILLNAWQDISL